MAAAVEGTSPSDVFDGWDPLLAELDGTEDDTAKPEVDYDSDVSDGEEKTSLILSRILNAPRSRSISMMSSSSSGPSTPTQMKPEWWYQKRIGVVEVPFTDCRSKRDYILLPIPSFIEDDHLWEMAYKVAELVQRTYFGEINTVERLHKFVVDQIMARLEAGKIFYSTFEKKDPKSPCFENWCENNMGAHAKGFAAVYALFFKDAAAIHDANLFRTTTKDGWLTKKDEIAVLQRSEDKTDVYNVLVAYGPIKPREDVDNPRGFGLFCADE